MAVPKKKTSKSRRDKRRANWKLTAPNLAQCPRCHELKLPHHVCRACGYYNTRSVLKIEEK